MDPDEVLQVLDRPKPLNPVHVMLMTGSMGLDAALGGGFPCGRIAELYGDPGVGKTAVALHTAALAQELGTVLWLDPMASFDSKRFESAGGDPTKLVFSQPGSAWQAVAAMLQAARGCSLMVLDTVTALEIERTDTPNIAHLLGELQRTVRKTGAGILVTNNGTVHERITGPLSVMMRVVASARVALRHERKDVRAVIAKANYLRPPFRQARFRIENGYIDWTRELLTLGLETGVLDKRGNWIFWGDQKLGNGVTNTAVVLQHYPGYSHAIREAVVSRISAQPTGA